MKKALVLIATAVLAAFAFTGCKTTKVATGIEFNPQTLEMSVGETHRVEFEFNGDELPSGRIAATVSFYGDTEAIGIQSSGDGVIYVSAKKTGTYTITGKVTDDPKDAGISGSMTIIIK